MRSRVMFLVAVGLIALHTPVAAQEGKLANDVRALLDAGKCGEARSLIQSSDDRIAFLRTPEGQALYAGALCYSSPSELDAADLDNALAYVRLAVAALTETHPLLAAWVRGAGNRCETLSAQVERAGRDRVVAEYAGKLLRECPVNAGAFSLQWTQAPSDIGPRTFDWTPLVPTLPGASEVDTAAVMFQPPPELVFRARADHVSGSGDVRVCAPFVVVSDSDARQVCDAALRFQDYFLATFRAAPPGAWIVIHHYTAAGRLQEHAQKHGGPTCPGVLGYHDWRHQTVVFTAQGGQYGTLQHELTHALVFWDAPLMPHWFEEGLAALFENTDTSYVGLPNPWRQELLKNIADPAGQLLDKGIRMPLVQFLEEPVNASIARATLMEVQSGGNLPALYDAIRRFAATHPEREDPFAPPTPERVAYWHDVLSEYLGGR